MNNNIVIHSVMVINFVKLLLYRDCFKVAIILLCYQYRISLFFTFIFLMCVCVWGGGGALNDVTSSRVAAVMIYAVASVINSDRVLVRFQMCLKTAITFLSY